MDTRINRRTMIRALSVAVLFVSAPVALSQTKGVVANDCGAQSDVGTCCQQAGAICNAGAGDNKDYCYRTDGSCQAGNNPCGG